MLILSLMYAWCWSARRIQIQVVNDAAKLPPRVRRKVARPAPSAIWFGGKSDIRMLRVGMKNNATPIPMNNCTRAMCW
ncbi:hypothetical protein D3C80_1824730 [compost metagenome]